MINPRPIALVVCESIYVDPSKKTALVGIFNTVRSHKFPCVHPNLCVYAAVTDVHAGTSIKVKIVHSETDEQVAEAKLDFPPQVNPGTICDMHFFIKNVRFKEPGRHYIELWSEELLLQRPFEVVLVQPGEKP
ncbi:MAG: hypothetical protein GXY44_10285 [Phycisphaerales bacterium]|nr:hypothetical protein [Phycisphaerales bacterium]